MPQYHEAQEFLGSLLHRLRDLPYESGLLRDLFRLTADASHASLESVSQVLSRGQGLSARVLSMANSAYYGLHSEVASVPRAVAVLGLVEVRNLVLSMGVAELTRACPFPPGFNREKHWVHQAGVAVAARCLARHAVRRGVVVDPDILYTAGLLHDLGKLLIAAFAPGAWLNIRALRDTGRALHSDDTGEQRRAEDALPLTDRDAEDRYWGVDHAVVGAHALAYWNLPEALTEPINWHHQPLLAGKYQPAATLLELADCLLHAQQTGDIALSAAVLTAGSDPLLVRLAPFVEDAAAFMEELDASLDPERLAALAAHLA